MAAVIGKRKREQTAASKPIKKLAALSDTANGSKTTTAAKAKLTTSSIKSRSRQDAKQADSMPSHGPIHIQIVTGSYERVLHGITATIPRERLLHDDAPPNPVQNDKNSDSAPRPDGGAPDVTFSHSFLFAAHLSAIRCLAISPATEEADKRTLATGSSDERINLYSLSTAPPPRSALAVNTPQLPTLASTTTAATAENPRNRSLGSLNHHDRAITCLGFPTRGKLFSGAEDATVAISRTRDWTMLSSIKAPIPKPQGRPSGDTAGPGEIPAGINAFAIHPSQKLMLTVGRGEKCMRLWNLMTGKKAGVLQFDRDLLGQVGEGKYSSGEGRRVLWDADGESYVVGFEKGAAVFGVDSKPRAVVRGSPETMKLHQMRFVPTEAAADAENEGDEDSAAAQSLLAASTEDGRILFFNVAASAAVPGDDASRLPLAPCVAELGGPQTGLTGRVKDFEILSLGGEDGLLLVLTASSDGAIRLWTLQRAELVADAAAAAAPTRSVGRLIATQETGSRITCVGAFLLDGKPLDGDEDEAANEGDEQDDEEFEGFDDA